MAKTNTPELKQPVFQNTVERNKAASRFCKQLFPAWCKPPFQGELQNIIVWAWQAGLTKEQAIQNAGNWWLWMRDQAIDNEFSSPARKKVMNIAINSAHNQQPIHIVASRSPEWLHAQVKGQGNPSLPRSRKSLEKLKQMSTESSQFLPTKVTVFLADLAIDNLAQIEKKCDVDEAVAENRRKLLQIATDINFSNVNFILMSELEVDGRKLSQLVGRDGKPKVDVTFNDRAQKLIDRVSRESIQSHQAMFGWSEQQSRAHNENLAVSMGFVGQALNGFSPPSILIHNEAFIARGALNNLFNAVDNPLPVICLADLLESKKDKQ